LPNVKSTGKQHLATSENCCDEGKTLNGNRVAASLVFSSRDYYDAEKNGPSGGKKGILNRTRSGKDELQKRSVAAAREFRSKENVSKHSRKEDKWRVHVNSEELNLAEFRNMKADGMAPVQNRVTTSKYTLYDFLLLNLFQQFAKVANVYFLIIAALQLFTPLSPTGRYSTAAPLALVSVHAAGLDSKCIHVPST
jgi:hypothetical protein